MAPEAGNQARGADGARTPADTLRIEQVAGEPGLARQRGELAEDLSFIVSVGEVERAGGIVPEAACLEDLAPDLQAAEGELARWARGLPYRPQHAEIADGSALGSLATLEHDHAAAPAGQMIGVRQPDDPRADDGIVECARHGESARRPAASIRPR